MTYYDRSACTVFIPEAAPTADTDKPWSTWWMLSYPDDHPNAGNYLIALTRIPRTVAKYVSTGTHIMAFDGGGVSLQWQFPAGSDACALSRGQNVVEMFKSGLLTPDSSPEVWTSLLYLPAGEVAIPRFPAL